MRIILMLLTGLLLTGCGYKEGVVQPAEASYLHFTGNLERVSVQIDNMEPFALKNTGGDESVIHQISPGQHVVKVFRNGELIVNRILLLDNQMTKEVMIQ